MIKRLEIDEKKINNIIKSINYLFEKVIMFAKTLKPELDIRLVKCEKMDEDDITKKLGSLNQIYNLKNNLITKKIRELYLQLMDK